MTIFRVCFLVLICTDYIILYISLSEKECYNEQVKIHAERNLL